MVAGLMRKKNVEGGKGHRYTSDLDTFNFRTAIVFAPQMFAIESIRVPVE